MPGYCGASWWKRGAHVVLLTASLSFSAAFHCTAQRGILTSASWKTLPATAVRQCIGASATASDGDLKRPAARPTLAVPTPVALPSKSPLAKWTVTKPEEKTDLGFSVNGVKISKTPSRQHSVDVNSTSSNIVARSRSRSGVVREFNNEIVRLGRAGQWREALQMLAEIQDKGFAPTAVSYNAAMGALNKNGQWAQALEMFDRVFAEDDGQARIKPDSFSYAAALSACAHILKWERAFFLFEEMESAGIEANSFTYSSLMIVCERSQQPGKALQVFEQMQARGIRPNAHTYVHRHQTQRPHQYKKYKKRQVYRPWSDISAATVLETNASSEGTPDHFLLPPGRDIPTPKGYSFIVPDVRGKTLPDGRTAPPPSLLALQELSLSKPLLSLQGLSAEYRLVL